MEMHPLTATLQPALLAPGTLVSGVMPQQTISASAAQLGANTPSPAQPVWFAAPNNVLTITLSFPQAAAVNAPNAAPAIAPVAHQIGGSHIANISLNLPAYATAATGMGAGALTTLASDASSFNTPDNQLAALRRMFELHEMMEKHVTEGFQKNRAPNGLSMEPEIIQKVNQVAHQIVSELMHGNMLMRIPPDDIMHLMDHVRDHALLYVNGLKGKDDFCMNTLKAHVMNHPKVKSFKEKHDPRNGHWTNMKYHPDTGMPSNTVLSAHMEHFGTRHSDYHDHGGYVSTHDTTHTPR